MKLRLTASLPFLLLAAPALADQPAQPTYAALPVGGYGIVCQRYENGRTPDCNVPVMWCDEAAAGHVMQCYTRTATLPTVQEVETTTICQREGGITHCRTAGR